MCAVFAGHPRRIVWYEVCTKHVLCLQAIQGVLCGMNYEVCTKCVLCLQAIQSVLCGMKCVQNVCCVCMQSKACCVV